ncbi:uncharacterized protein MELLADRAFT_102963 [Melampsora larici-populina 98AG31]|uniref:Uncharacterized protein n=1 Tax=Melampsora larici-populina (strain 98AG31 / pathotype 3-4-7) TaxID=747676 RepID=F4RA35_MELLP|nr:uncharacterized protein MELLADRAFT_102963 [Melampsora larici-populina 98AG31]EGG10412.1 hypothetical protein MELLADRAFT_102963 [Melampsora larici-populina 98AG31]
MSTQPTSTQLTPSSNAGLKRPRIDDGGGGRQNGNPGGGESDSEGLESSGGSKHLYLIPMYKQKVSSLDYSNGHWAVTDGDLTREEILERKKFKTARLKVQSHIRHRNEGIGKVAASHEIPKAATPLARAIQEFSRMLMGIPRNSRTDSALENAGLQKLPEPPSDAERHAWETRKQRRETFVREAQDKAMVKYLARKGPGFKPNRKQKKTVEKDAAEMATLKNPMQPVIFSSRIYAHHFGTQCEASLAMAGFPRCTFDWLASYDTPWNSAMSLIILAHWVKTYDANGARDFGILVSDNTASNREEVLRRWVGNKATKYREQTRNCELYKTPEGQKILKDNIEINKSITRKRLNKTKIVDARLTQATRLFGKDSLEVAMLSPPEVHSDEELMVSNGSGSRQKLRLEWRSSELDTLINLLDQVHQKRQILPKEKRLAKQLIERGVYSPNPDADKFPPKGYQLSLVSPNWYGQQDGLLIAELELDETNAWDIKNLIMEVMDTFKSMSERAAAMAGVGGSNSMLTQ